MLTNKKYFLIIIFSLVTFFFVFNFIKYINFSLESNKEFIDESILFTETIDDEIYPYCDGLDFLQINKSTVSHLDINIANRQKWYENLFNLSLESQRAIKLKYKKSYEAKLSIFYDEKISCNFNAEVKISGDWNDHIDKINLISSMDIKLLDGNINGITRFKLFLPETRNKDNEIITTTVLSELGFITPRTFYIDVGTVNHSNNYIRHSYIFQEKPSKEMVEFYNFRESPIYEVNESFMWNEVLNKSYNKNREQGLYSLIIAKTLNKNWSKRGSVNAQITLEGLEKFNKAIFNSYNPGSQLNYNFLGSDLNMFFRYDAANIALLAEHGMTNHNRRFFYNVIEDQFYPIYYDGNSNIVELGHVRGRGDYQNREGLALGAAAILDEKPINYDDFYNKLLINGLEITKEESKKILEKFYNNLNEISNYLNNKEIVYRTFIETSNLLVNEENINFIFYDVENSLIEKCEIDLNNCKSEVFKIEMAELFSEKVIKNNYQGYLVGTNKKNLINTNLENQKKILKIDEINIELVENPEINIDNEKKNIKIYLNSIDQKIKIYGPGKMENWNIEIASNLKIEEQESRIDSNLLTGCLTFYNLEVNNLSIETESMFCEDAVNFIRVSGQNIDLTISNSSFDGLDADFSHLEFNQVNISNSGNDCLDLSGGNYKMNNFIGKNCIDKAISIGEKANLDIFQSFIDNAKIGIAIKDSSISEINKLVIENVDICVAAYRKKQEFGPGKISVENLDCSAKYPNFIQKGSVLNIGS